MFRGAAGIRRNGTVSTTFQRTFRVWQCGGFNRHCIPQKRDIMNFVIASRENVRADRLTKALCEISVDLAWARA